MRFIGCLLLLSVVVHTGAAGRESNPFGICNPWDGLDELGVGWCRMGAGSAALDWGRMAPEPDVLNFDEADRELTNWLEPYGIRQLALLGYTPDWASSAPEDAENRRAYPPQDLRDWSRYIEQTVAYFGDRILDYEVWNEPDIHFWEGTANEYASLLKSAYLAIKRANPEAQVVFGGLAGINIPFMRECYEHGVGGYFDVMAVHPYQWGETFNDGWFRSQILDMRDLMLEFGDDRPIYLTEFGWVSDGTPEGEDRQARLLMQAILTGLVLREEARVDVVFPFTVRDWDGAWYGFLRDDGTPKPVWHAYAALIDNLLGMRAAARLELPDPLRGVVFQPESGEGEAVAVVWSSDSDTHEATLALGSDSYTLTDMLGESRTVTATDESLLLEIGPQPQYISGFGEGLPSHTLPIEQLPEFERNDRIPPPVWMSLDIPPHTRRAYVQRGKPSGVRLLLHNDSDKAQSVSISYTIDYPGQDPIGRNATAHIAPWEQETVLLDLGTPPSEGDGLADLRVDAMVADQAIPPLLEKLRLTNTFAIEFLAGSAIERRFLVDSGQSATAPSVRFGGTGWVYGFDLSHADHAAADLYVGAHEAGYWRVSASIDGQLWDTLVEGRSNRDWHTIDLTPYAGDVVYVRIDGGDGGQQQIEEAVLTAAAS